MIGVLMQRRNLNIMTETHKGKDVDRLRGNTVIYKPRTARETKSRQDQGGIIPSPSKGM